MDFRLDHSNTFNFLSSNDNFLYKKLILIIFYLCLDGSNTRKTWRLSVEDGVNLTSPACHLDPWSMSGKIIIYRIALLLYWSPYSSRKMSIILLLIELHHDKIILFLQEKFGEGSDVAWSPRERSSRSGAQSCWGSLCRGYHWRSSETWTP